MAEIVGVAERIIKDTETDTFSVHGEITETLKIPTMDRAII